MLIANNKLLLSVLVVELVLVYFLQPQNQRRQVTQQKEMASLLARFQSPDEEDAAEAKAALAAMGESAIQPLVLLLKTAKTQPSEYLATLRDDRRQMVLNRPVDGDVDYYTRSRVERDIYELLGQLHASEAVPLLVSIMEDEEIDNLIQGMSPVMRGLAAIGPAAVPKIIESIDEAQTTASTPIKRRFAGYSEEVQQRQLGWLKGRIEWRGILVLRAIGDQRALPVLNKVQFTSDNKFIAEQAKEAAEKILAQNPGPK